MTKIYFVRHCETTANRDRVIQGTLDYDVSEEGIHQLECLAGRFKDIHIDRVYTSPLTRTYKTALAIKGNRDIEIVKMRDFIEFDFGRCQGMDHDRMQKRYPKLYFQLKNEFYKIKAPGGESFADLYERVWRATREVIEQERGKTVAVASHGGSIRALFSRFLYNDPEMLYSVPSVVNTAVYEVDFFDDNSFEIKLMNDSSHLDKKAAVRLEI